MISDLLHPVNNKWLTLCVSINLKWQRAIDTKFCIIESYNERLTK